MTWIELLSVLLLVLLGMSLWPLCESWTRDHLGDGPSEESIQERHSIPRLQRELTKAEEEWKAALAELVRQRLEAARQAVELDALMETYPGVHLAEETAPKEARAKYLEIRTQQAASARLTTRLPVRVAGLEARVSRSSAALSQARREVAKDLEQAREDFEWRRRWETLGRAVSVTLLLLLAVWAVLALAVRRVRQRTGRDLGLRTGRVTAASAALLVLLFGYQMLQALWIGLASVLLLALLLITFFRAASTSHG